MTSLVAAAADGPLQRRHAHLRLHPVDALGRHWRQPDRRRHRRLLRLRLEPDDGRAGAGQVSPYRADT